MWREELLLIDIIERCDLISHVAAGTDRETFLDDDVAQSAVLYALVIIGEASRGITDTLSARHPGVPWGQMVAFRNLAVHAYPEIDARRVWDTATNDVPSLRSSVAGILASEFPLAAKALDERAAGEEE